MRAKLPLSRKIKHLLSTDWFNQPSRNEMLMNKNVPDSVGNLDPDVVQKKQSPGNHVSWPEVNLEMRSTTC